MDPREIKTHSLFEALFPINPELLEEIEKDMRDDGFDDSQRIVLATWTGQKEPVCIDGHTRLKAAINVGIDIVPVWEHEFETEEEALQKAIKLQKNRRNMTDADLLRCVEALDKRDSHGGDRKSDEAKIKAQGCALIEQGKSAEATAATLGISPRKVEQTRTVLDHADEETKRAVANGEKSINRACQETQARRRAEKEQADKPVVESVVTDEGIPTDEEGIRKHCANLVGFSVKDYEKLIYLHDHGSWELNTILDQLEELEISKIHHRMEEADWAQVVRELEEARQREEHPFRLADAIEKAKQKRSARDSEVQPSRDPSDLLNAEQGAKGMQDLEYLAPQKRASQAGNYTEAVRLSGVAIEYLNHVQKDDPNAERELLSVRNWIDKKLEEIRKSRSLQVVQ
jgi:hypothetical protein